MFPYRVGPSGPQALCRGRRDSYDPSVTAVDALASGTAAEELLRGLVPGLAALELPADPADAARALGIQPAAFVPMPDGALQAEFEFPEQSLWRIWPHRRTAIWIGSGHPTSRPPVRWAWRTPAVALPTALGELSRAGAWLQEARLLTPDGWTSLLPAAVIPKLLPDAGAVAGVWSLIDGRAVRAALFDDGRLWGETPQQTERWLLRVAAVSTAPAP